MRRGRGKRRKIDSGEIVREKSEAREEEDFGSGRQPLENCPEVGYCAQASGYIVFWLG